MKQDNVIQFPKEQAVRVRLRERGTQQKAVLALSILSVLMLSVLTNQWLTRAESGAGNSRTIASLGSSSMVSDVKWEHELARQLSQSKGLAAHFAVKPSLRDQMVFGELEGRYGVHVKDGRVESVEFTGQQGSSPLSIGDRTQFLTKYRSVFALDYSQVGLSSSQNGEEVYNLMGSDRTIVGRAKLMLDAEGRLTGLTLAR